MKTIINQGKVAVDLFDETGESCTVQPGTSVVEDRFTINLPPKIIIKGE